MLFWLSVLLAGVSLFCVLLMLARPWLQSCPVKHAGSLGFALKILWPWVHVVATLSKPFVTWGTRQKLSNWVALAGLGGLWQPEHIVALRVLAGLLAAGLWLVAGFFQLGLSGESLLLGASVVTVFASYLPLHQLKRRARERQLHMLREFPFLLDMTTLCVEAGLNLQGALIQAVQHGPPGALKTELGRALSDMRAGMPRMAALRSFAERTGLPAVSQWVMAVDQADQLGMSLGPILRAQSDQRRNERFLRAEKLALEAPVKMLFPMVVCIFPCTFLVIGFPIAVKLFAVDF